MIPSTTACAVRRSAWVKEIRTRFVGSRVVPNAATRSCGVSSSSRSPSPSSTMSKLSPGSIGTASKRSVTSCPANASPTAISNASGASASGSNVSSIRASSSARSRSATGA